MGYKFLQAHTTWYRLEVTAEEFMEMFGASLILLAALQLRRRIRNRLSATSPLVQGTPVNAMPNYQAVS